MNRFSSFAVGKGAKKLKAQENPQDPEAGSVHLHVTCSDPGPVEVELHVRMFRQERHWHGRIGEAL
jgi:hypothetical protein